MAVLLAVVVIALQPSSALWALPVLTLWAISPYFAYHTGLPRQGDRQMLDARDRRELRHTARLTWRFFEEVVTAGDNWLVPDNYQENRPDPIAHRTSPTNIGLQMMAAVSAWDLGYLSAAECLTRLDRTVDSLHKLPRYRGHFFNWYDTQSLVPLAPLYVSTVDSGNFLGYLMTISHALPSIAEGEVLIDRRFQDGLSDVLDLFEREATPVVASLGRDSARDFRADVRRIRAVVDATARRRGRRAATGCDRCRLNSRCSPPASTTRSTGCLPGDAKVADAGWWLDAAAPMIRERRGDLAAFAAIGGRRSERNLRATAARIAGALEQFVHTHRARLSLRSASGICSPSATTSPKDAATRPTTTRWRRKHVSPASSPSRCGMCRRSTGSSWDGS